MESLEHACSETTVELQIQHLCDVPIRRIFRIHLVKAAQGYRVAPEQLHDPALPMYIMTTV